MRNRPSSSRTSPHVLNPLKILTQIVTLQAAYYILASALILFTALASGKPFSVDLVFSWQSLRGDTAVGWTLSLCWIVVAGIGWVSPFFFLLLFLPHVFDLSHLFINMSFTRRKEKEEEEKVFKGKK